MNLIPLLPRGAAVLLAFPLFLSAQGSLTPAGVPTPTMRTLEQLGTQLDDVQRRVETRIVLSSTMTPGDGTSVYHINRPGSYVLNENLSVPAGKSGIVIACSGVSVDLNGYAIEGGMGSLSGVYVLADGGLTTLNNVSVGNGSITGTHAGGVIAGSPVNVMSVEDLRIRAVGGQGVSFDGDGGRVERVQVNGASDGGISLQGAEGLVVECSVATISGTPVGGMWGIRAAVVRDCVVRDLASSGGGELIAIGASVVQGCRVLTVTGTQASTAGISATTVEDCVVSTVQCSSPSTDTMLYGINATVVRGCSVSSVGSGNSAGACGIRGDTVDGCSVISVTGKNPYGINGKALDSINGAAGTVRGCRVLNVAGVSGSTEAHGIWGYEIQGCTAGTVSNTTSAAGLRGSNVVDSVASEVNALNPSGITASGNVRGCQVRNIIAYAGATATWGINASAGVISDCVVTMISSPSTATYGILGATVRNCRLTSIATDSESSGKAYGIATALAGVVEGNSLQGVRNIGIYPGQGAVVRDNAIFDAGYVAGVVDGKAIQGLTGCRIEGNTIGGNAPDYGIFVESGMSGCLIVGNQCTGTFSGASTGAALSNTGAYNIPAGNRLGTILTGAGVITVTSGALVNIAN